MVKLRGAANFPKPAARGQGCHVLGLGGLRVRTYSACVGLGLRMPVGRHDISDCGHQSHCFMVFRAAEGVFDTVWQGLGEWHQETIAENKSDDFRRCKVVECEGLVVVLLYHRFRLRAVQAANVLNKYLERTKDKVSCFVLALCLLCSCFVFALCLLCACFVLTLALFLILTHSNHNPYDRSLML